MSYVARPTNSPPLRVAAIARAMRGTLPPPVGIRWRLDPHDSNAELVTTNPLLGERRHGLLISDGWLSGIDGGLLEVSLQFDCRQASFRATSILHAETFRYVTQGHIEAGANRGAAEVRIHDLSWTAGVNGSEDRRILTLTAQIDRTLWKVPESRIPVPWLTRDSAELFVHTEWVPERDHPAA